MALLPTSLFARAALFSPFPITTAQIKVDMPAKSVYASK
jgi:hypothetical protein